MLLLQANLLWIPLDSSYNTNQAWLDENFRKTTRDELVIFEGQNVLTPGAIQQVGEVTDYINHHLPLVIVQQRSG